MAEFELDLSELDSEADLSERAAPKRPSSQPSFRLRPPQGTPSAVTQAQLEAALSRVDGKIKTVADGVSTLSSRVGSIASATRKEIDDRKKTLDNSNKDLNSKMMMLALLPALSQPTYTLPPVQIPQNALGAGSPAQAVGLQYVPATGTPPAAGSSYNASADPNTLNLMLPLLAVTTGGFGGSDSSGGFGGLDNNAMLMMMVVLAMTQAKKN
jgi:hypothetical protein